MGFMRSIVEESVYLFYDLLRSVIFVKLRRLIFKTGHCLGGLQSYREDVINK